MPSASAASLPMEASCLPEMFFSNSPVPAVATTLPAESSVSVSILGNLCQIVVFSKKEPGALLFIDLQITRSLTVTMPSLAEAGVPSPHALHLWLGAHPICLSTAWLEQQDANESIPCSPGISQARRAFCYHISVWGRLGETFGSGLILKHFSR